MMSFSSNSHLVTSYVVNQTEHNPNQLERGPGLLVIMRNLSGLPAILQDGLGSYQDQINFRHSVSHLS